MAKREKPVHSSDAWKAFHDPSATEADYQRWREQHHARVMQRAVAMVQDALPRNYKSADAAGKALGLSPGTIRNYQNPAYVKNLKRGPLLRTYLLLRGKS